MNRVCVTKNGKLIEMQGGGDDREDLMEMRLGTLKQNAINAGYAEDEIDVKWVTDEEWTEIQANIYHHPHATTEIKENLTSGEAELLGEKIKLLEKRIEQLGG